MKLNLRFKHILLLACVVFVQFSFAQQKETDYYYYLDKPSEYIAIDTTLDDMESYNFMQTETWDYFNLGNTGQAHRYTAFEWNDTKGFKNGFTAFDRYKYHIEDIKYYKIEKPISEINYFLGSKRENIFGAKFAHNIKNRLSYGIDFHRIASNGVYQNIRTRNGDFSMYGVFSSKNSKYDLSLAMTFSKLKSEENGGIPTDFVNNPLDAEPNKEFYEPFLDNALTEHKNFNVLVSNTYHFGYAKTDSINDTLAVRSFYPSFSISHTTGTQKNTFSYLDESPVDSIYNDFYQIDDSLYYRMYYHQLPNAISLSYSGLKRQGDTIAYRNFMAEASIQHDNIELWQNRKEFTTNNLHVAGKIQSNAWSNKKWNYTAKAYYYLAGYNQNDWKVEGQFGYDFAKFGQLNISASAEQQEASWIENSFFSTSQTWENDFNKKSRTRVALDYFHQKLKLRLHAEYNVIGNYIFFDENGLPQQLSSLTNYWQAYASKELQFKILHFNNFIGVQRNNNQAALRLPSLFLKSSLYIEGSLFKGNMLARFGADLRYNSNFRADVWNPVIGQFHIQNEQTMHYTPVLDIFLSFKVRTLRVFVKANYVNEGLIKKNYYTALGYPDRGRTFAGGLIWRFFE